MSPLYGPSDLANNSPKFAARLLQRGSGKTNQAANNTSLYGNGTLGVFGVNAAKMANTTGEGSKVTAPGWNIRRTSQGPVAGVSVTAGGSGFANGETALVSGGTSNSVVSLTSNSNGNLVGAAISGAPGAYSNTSQITIGFRREKHVTSITVADGSGYDNTDILVVSNGAINATATLVTNSTGGFANADITLTAVGLFGNTQANTAVDVTALAANGAASNGTGATLAAVLATSTGGNLAFTLGGRAGRVTYECLVEMSSIQSNGNIANTYLPQ